MSENNCVSTKSMITARAYYPLISYGDALYAIAGHNGDRHNKVERYSRQLGWTSLAAMPYNSHRYQCFIYLKNRKPFDDISNDEIT